MSIDEDLSPAQAGMVLANHLRESTKAPVTITVDVRLPDGTSVLLDKNQFDVTDGMVLNIRLSEAPRFRKEIEEYVRHQREEGRAAYYRGDPKAPWHSSDWKAGYDDAAAAGR